MRFRPTIGEFGERVLRQYEAMCVFDPTVAADFHHVEAEIDRLMKRAEAQVIVSKKWDERKLAYEIQGRKRGCYVLTYFRADPSKIVGLQRDIELSEAILRGLILSAEGMTEEQMLRSIPTGSERPERSERGDDEGGHRRSRSERRHESPRAPAREEAVAVATDEATED